MKNTSSRKLAREFTNLVLAKLSESGAAVSSPRFREAVLEYATLSAIDGCIPFVTFTSSSKGMQVNFVHSSVRFQMLDWSTTAGTGLAESWLRLFNTTPSYAGGAIVILDDERGLDPIQRVLTSLPDPILASSLEKVVYTYNAEYTPEELRDPSAVAAKDAALKSACSLWNHAARYVAAKRVATAGEKHLKCLANCNIAIPAELLRSWTVISKTLKDLNSAFDALICEVRTATAKVRANRSAWQEQHALDKEASSSALPRQDSSVAEMAEELAALLKQFQL